MIIIKDYKEIITQAELDDIVAYDVTGFSIKLGEPKILIAHIQNKAAPVLAMKNHLIDIRKPLNKMALDYLMSIELRSKI
ncbi:hypothetical protein [Moorena sp. SIO4G3]|uniref:hypothetical protein n=1 Tax=Moorena sp. SIO4G3 TaxID=2607821 RepID=UPI00142C48D3|nr:hypothetical protein [Moorena sp. SIO4G3]NEO82038.1 hypothetical protein [Moorena sp. SIO4G3]